MSDTTALSRDEILAKAKSDYEQMKADVEALIADVESEPGPATPTLDRIRREEDKIAEEQARVEQARRERQAQRATALRKLDAARDALEAVGEQVASAKRREQDEIEERMSYERARQLWNEREAQRRLESLTGQASPPSPAKKAAERISQLLGLPVSPTALMFAGSAGGEDHFTWYYHGFGGWARVDIEGVELRPKSPAHGGLISNDPLDYLSMSWFVEREKKFDEKPAPDAETK